MTSEILGMYRKTARVYKSKETLELGYIVALNASGVLKKVRLYEDEKCLRVKVRRQ